MLRMKGSATEPVNVVVTPYTRFKGRGSIAFSASAGGTMSGVFQSVCQSFKVDVAIVLCSCQRRPARMADKNTAICEPFL